MVGQGKEGGLYPPSGWCHRIGKLELPLAWSPKTRGLEPPSSCSLKIRKLVLPRNEFLLTYNKIIMWFFSGIGFPCKIMVYFVLVWLSIVHCLFILLMMF
jgi:hypothetical protein